MDTNPSRKGKQRQVESDLTGAVGPPVPRRQLGGSSHQNVMRGSNDPGPRWHEQYAAASFDDHNVFAFWSPDQIAPPYQYHGDFDPVLPLNPGVMHKNVEDLQLFRDTLVPSPAPYSTCSPPASTISRDCSVCSTSSTEPDMSSTPWGSSRQNSTLHADTSGPSSAHQRTSSHHSTVESNVTKHMSLSCLWGASNESCKGVTFETREELNRHVKVEHLLECPEKGCTESTFETRDLLDRHMKLGHCTNTKPTSQATKPLEAGLGPPRNAPGIVASEEQAIASGQNDPRERHLKREMSIGIYKKRCREQLKTAVEKRLRRANGTSRSADSPGVVRNRNLILESAGFPLVWEHGVLPFLIEFMPKWCGPGHTISVVRGKTPNTRRICIVTKDKVTRARKMIIMGHVLDLLPETHRNTVTFIFSTGKVNRLKWARGLGRAMPDEVCDPRNPFAYVNPCMGDSIGLSLEDGEEITATLGPCLTTENGSYWLASFHPFENAKWWTTSVHVEHPSPQDRAQCTQECHDALKDRSFKLGELTAASGFDLKTTRITHHPYWDDYDRELPLVVTDWVLISTGIQQANLLRRFPNDAAQRCGSLVTSTTWATQGASVISTGRTSGVQKGQVCEIPAYVDGTANGTGKATREWFVEEPYTSDDEDAWIRGGIGVEGDSGAAIVDSDTNTLVGQLWGRNAYWGPGPRITYFTPIFDLFDDVQERCNMPSRPKLPQYRDRVDRWPVYPICRECFDLQEYRGSRRSSRVSMASLIGAHEGRGEHDNDLTSVSDLATPQNHAGPEDPGTFSSGFSAFSPQPIHTFYQLFQGASPNVTEIRSPYPQALNDDDLYETNCPQASKASLGKRPSLISTQEESTARQENKRRRFDTGFNTLI